MNKYEKEVEKVLLDNERDILKSLEKVYTEALANIKGRISQLQGKSDELTQSTVYQINFQKNLEKQVSSIIDVLKNDIKTGTNAYLTKMYEDAFVGTSYNLSKSYNMNTVIEIDQEAVLMSVNKKTDDMTFAERTDVNMQNFKKNVKSEISRGFAISKTYAEMAQSISLVAEKDMYKAYRIARTEGLRVSSESKLDYAKKVKNRYGADLVKQWDSTLDGKTRAEHQQLDGQYKEIDEYFECSAGKAKAPGLFGNPAMDCNCRCCLLQLPRWAVNKSNTKIDNTKQFKENGEVNLISSKNYNEYKKKYFKYLNNTEKNDNINNIPKFNKKILMLNQAKYSEKEIIEISNATEKIANKYTNNESKWSGKIEINNVEPSAKLWSCNIRTQNITSPHELLHEQLHAHSISYYDGNIYMMYRNIEEASVEFFAQEISKKEGIIINFSAYESMIENLRKINSIAKIENDDYTFAKKLFDIPVIKRLNYIEEKINEYLKDKTIDEAMKLNSLMEVLYV